MSSSLFQKIETAFQKINELSKSEKEVEINGQKIVLGIPTGEEDNLIQIYVNQRAEEHGKTTILRDIKVETVAFAIKAINKERIDDVDFFTTIGPDKKEVKVEKHIFLRDTVSSWPGFIVNYLFNQYVALTDESSESLKPEFKIEGVNDLLKAELSEQEQILKEAEKQTEEQKSEPSFRKIEEAGDGILDQG